MSVGKFAGSDLATLFPNACVLIGEQLTWQRVNQITDLGVLQFFPDQGSIGVICALDWYAEDS
jgi:hypothetical protein